MSNDEVSKLVDNITSSRTFDQWTSELLFYISESGFINEQRKSVIQQLESSDYIEKLYEALKDEESVKKLIVDSILQEFATVEEGISRSVTSAIESQNTYWKDNIKEHISNLVKNSHNPSNFQVTSSDSSHQSYNYDRYKSRDYGQYKGKRRY